jgi:hypothetical protein
MAKPIEPTPVLKGKEAAKFLANVYANENKPATLTPTPKLDKAYELAKQYADRKK